MAKVEIKSLVSTLIKTLALNITLMSPYVYIYINKNQWF